MANMNKKILVALAEGFEEIEALTPVDLLRRCGGEVSIAGVGSTNITGGHGIKVTCDMLISEAGLDYDAIIIPGGGLGARNLSESWEVHEKMLMLVNQGALLASICASPAVVLGPAGLLNGHRAVCYPGAEVNTPDFEFSDEPVCVDGNLITARGAGCAVDFSLAIIEHLYDKETSDRIRSAIIA
ncbi:MAG: DJ-1/PfpI family protein [Sphaerochaetaceae bacterium]|nr:DJ-1/PfpI family protein [Sphaerochaetaceae bacterium]